MLNSTQTTSDLRVVTGTLELECWLAISIKRPNFSAVFSSAVPLAVMYKWRTKKEKKKKERVLYMYIFLLTYSNEIWVSYKAEVLIKVNA